jgi:hypothetical protein
MTDDDSVSDRSRKLGEEFERFVNGDSEIKEDAKTTLEDLVHNFGLSLSQATAWLKKEPNFSSDVSYHEPKNRRKVNRTLFWVLLPLCRIL